jgi:hypothetical protein
MKSPETNTPFFKGGRHENAGGIYCFSIPALRATFSHFTSSDLM